MRDVTFRTSGGLAGWVRAGAGDRVVLLHGGPGLGYEYLESLLPVELVGRTVASFQQRGLAPSSATGPFDVATAVADVVEVVQHLGWEQPVLLGHSWGGWLAWRTVASRPGLAAAVLAVDPVGTVGDGGRPAFRAELFSRVPMGRRRKLERLWGSADPDDAREALRLVWPSYFADPEDAPACPLLRVAGAEVAALAEELPAAMPDLERALGSLRVPMGAVVGGGSPMPRTSAADVVDRWPGAWISDVPGGGHFPWLVEPGCIRSALDRLVG